MGVWPISLRQTNALFDANGADNVAYTNTTITVGGQLEGLE